MPQTGARLVAINPYFLVDDVHQSAEYYREVLGFSFDQFWGEPPAFVMVKRDAIMIMLREPAAPDGTSVVQPNSPRLKHAFDAYLRVSEVDALYAEFSRKGAKLLYEPCDRPHDCREFEVEDCNGYRLCFGQDLLA
ncbi:MAG: VOC family protein [bacterium]